ncbi:MAG: hypothetical protein AB7O79_07970 [Xanthobacteraceae bacterium]
MIEAIMFFTLGFLGATLIALVALSAIWHRAVRLTTKRIEGAIPVSMVEIQADKDQLRAEFAMKMRKLETTVERVKGKETEYLAELGRRSERIFELKTDGEAKAERIGELETIEKNLREKLQTTETALAEKTATLAQTEQTLSARVQELAATQGTLGTVTNESENRQVEILALRTERDTLQIRSETLAREKKATEDRLTNRERELSDHLAKREGELLDAATARESELNRELASLREKLAGTEKMFGQLQGDTRALSEELREKSSAFQATTEILRGEKSNLENTLFELRREHERINEEAASLRAQLNKAQIEEREESALLRDRINDVAAEIARLAINLEGEPSPLEEILASPNGKPRPAQNGASRRRLSLADRIRDLQNRAR